jgi:hypothetical protein
MWRAHRVTDDVRALDLQVIHQADDIEAHLGHTSRARAMGTIASPWRYDAVARQTLQSAKLRQSAISCDTL